MSFCTKCLNPISNQNSETIELIKREYLLDDKPWVIGFSGGKDSSALVKLVYTALLSIKNPTKPVYLVYCDTGVEIPTISILVKKTLNNIRKEARGHGLPIKIKLARPENGDSYFVKVIGRGYPPPTNIFRWCTDRLRINPVKKVIQSLGSQTTILLGVRKGESNERDRTLGKHSTDNNYYYRQANTKKVIFTPIIDYKTKDIWATLQYTEFPKSIDGKKLGQLYKDAGNECPVIKDTKGTPCGQGRFGCWTCTVVRKDKAVTSMVNEGYTELKPLLDFRNWLIEIRDQEKYRNSTRRNGQIGLGPFNLHARKLILNRLLLAGKKSKLELITKDEIKEIKFLWAVDKKSNKYVE